MKADELIQSIFKFNHPAKILDVGANRGQSLLKFKEMFPFYSTSIFAYEPNPDLAVMLEALNIENCHVLQRAVVGDVNKHRMPAPNTINCADSEIILHVCPKNSTISTISPEFMQAISKNNYFMSYMYSKQVAVPYTQVSLLAKSGFDLVKFDTEGCDAELVSGYLLSLLEYQGVTRPRLMICEYTSELKSQYIELLHQFKQYYPLVKLYFDPASCGYLTNPMNVETACEFFEKTPEDGYWGDIYIQF